MRTSEAGGGRPSWASEGLLMKPVDDTGARSVAV